MSTEKKPCPACRGKKYLMYCCKANVRGYCDIKHVRAGWVDVCNVCHGKGTVTEVT